MGAAIRLSPAEVEDLAVQALVASRTSRPNAESTARALVAADCAGQAGHGLSRLPAYARQALVGKVDGTATPTLEATAGGVLRIDARGGFAYPAIDLAVAALIPLAGENGVACAAIRNSHHAGQLGLHVERLAEAGLVAMAFANTPRAMAFHGGCRPRLGTNPLALAAPLAGRPPLVIDLALSMVARSRIVAAERDGAPLEPGWAVDGAGRPTTDPVAALAGALTPLGGAKGAALAMGVEVLCAALAGGRFGWESTSLLDDQGEPPGIGQLIVVFDLRTFAGDFAVRMACLTRAVAADGARLPGDSRLAARARARLRGLPIPAALHRQMLALIGETPPQQG